MLESSTRIQVLAFINDLCHRIKSKCIVELREPIPDSLISSWSTTVHLEHSSRGVNVALFRRQMALEGKTKLCEDLKGLDEHWLFEHIDRRSIQILVDRILSVRDFEEVAG